MATHCYQNRNSPTGFDKVSFNIMELQKQFYITGLICLLLGGLNYVWFLQESDSVTSLR